MDTSVIKSSPCGEKIECRPTQRSTSHTSSVDPIISWRGNRTHIYISARVLHVIVLRVTYSSDDRCPAETHSNIRVLPLVSYVLANKHTQPLSHVPHFDEYVLTHLEYFIPIRPSIPHPDILESTSISHHTHHMIPYTWHDKNLLVVVSLWLAAYCTMPLLLTGGFSILSGHNPLVREILTEHII